MSKTKIFTHRFKVGQERIDDIGIIYRVTRLRGNSYTKLAGQPCYNIRTLKNGKFFGLTRILTEGALMMETKPIAVR